LIDGDAVGNRFFWVADCSRVSFLRIDRNHPPRPDPLLPRHRS